MINVFQYCFCQTERLLRHVPEYGGFTACPTRHGFLGRCPSLWARVCAEVWEKRGTDGRFEIAQHYATALVLKFAVEFT